MKKLAITSVYANPIHPGHIDSFELSKSVAGADELWVIVNNDKQAELKRGVPSFQDEVYRCRIIEALKVVDKVFLSVDEDRTVCVTLKSLIEKALATGQYQEIIFTKGGDRFAGEIPEAVVCGQFGVKIVDGLGEKTHNSSEYALKRSV